jgi:site-specific DNA recombinase
MKRAVIYARVSTDKQRDNYSIQTQVAECASYARQKGYSLVGEVYIDPDTGNEVSDMPGMIPAYVDDISSWEYNRPGLDSLIGFLKKGGADLVIVHSIDRLAREPEKLRIFEYGFMTYHAEVEYVKGEYQDNPEGQFFKTVISASAKLENDWRVERCNRGKREKARAGLFVAGRPPFGYVIDKNALGGLAVHPEEAEAVKIIFDLYINQSMSIRNIVRELNERSIPTRQGGAWGKSSVNRILENTAYIGKVHYQKNKRMRTDKKTWLKSREEEEWIGIEVTPLIDPDTFELARQKLAHNRDYVRRTPARSYLLSGKIICSECSRPYLAQAKKPNEHNRLAQEGITYRHRMRAGHCCNKTIGARTLEPIVWEKIESLLLEPENLRRGFDEAKQLEKEKYKQSQIELSEIDRKIEKLEKKKDNLTQLYTDPDIEMPKDEYVRQRRIITEEIAELNKHKGNLEKPKSTLPSEEEFKNLEQFAKEIQNRLLEKVPTQKNKCKVLDLLHVQVKLNPDGGGTVNGWFGERVLLDTSSIHYALQQRPLRGHV